MREYLNSPFELKSIESDGTFSGYASIFSTVDRGREVVMPNSFKEIIKNEDGKVTVLWQHKTDQPIGVADVRQDAKGLRFEGQLVLEDPLARVAQAHMRAKSVRGMSFGYDSLKDSVKDGIRYISELRCWEISLCTFPMHPDAQVSSVKSCTTTKDLERMLHQGTMVQLSRRKAAAAAIALWPFVGNGEDDPEAELSPALKSEIARALAYQVLKS